MSNWIDQLDEHAKNGDWPTWDNANYTAGAMRASGLTSAEGTVLVFEVIHYACREGLIGRRCYAFGPGARSPGFCGFGAELVSHDALIEDVDAWTVRSRVTGVTLRPQMRGKRMLGTTPVLPPEGLATHFSTMVLGQVLTLPTDPARIPGSQVDPRHLRRLSPGELVLFWLCDTFPRDVLFSTANELAAALDLHDTRVLFTLDDWQHVSNEAPSSSLDLVAMVEALEAGQGPPRQSGSPNGDYRFYLEELASMRPVENELWGGR